ncbi:MAG: hypothetical protein AAFV88_00245 [Planctomycetota bacterium]
MPWPTTYGLRRLGGGEADLIRGALGMMVDTHVAELRENVAPWTYGVPWFDQWDARQRLWLLEHVTRALLGAHRIDEPAAMFDAAADAIFFELADLIEIELEAGQESRFEQEVQPQRSWRESIAAAIEWQRTNLHGAVVEDTELQNCISEWNNSEGWNRMITRLGDSILGVRLYRKAESFRDGDIEQTKRFLRDRGLPETYLEAMPPLRSIDQTQLSIDRIQAYVFQDGD